MHANSMRLMREFVERYLGNRRGRTVLDVGSYDQNGSYRDLFGDHNYIGGDIRDGPNVDLVFSSPYAWCSGSYDVIVSGQTLEHVEDVHSWIMELARRLKPGGVTCIIAPWQWEKHRYPVDCWRILPDGMRWLFCASGLNAIEVWTDGPDTVGIARKPVHREREQP